MLSITANAMDVVAILRDELHFDTKQVNAIVNLARASGEPMWASKCFCDVLQRSFSALAGDASKDNTVEIAAVVEHAFDALRQLVEWDIVRGTRPAPADGAAAAARA